MKRFLLLILWVHLFDVKAQRLRLKPESLNTVSLGTDLSQLNYYFSTDVPNLHFGLWGQYKYNQALGLQAAYGINRTGSERSQGYSNLDDYQSSGFYLKIGPEFSFRVARNKYKRFCIGFMYNQIDYRESGVFTIKDPYWGDYVYEFRSVKNNFSTYSFNIAYQFGKKNWQMKVQIYDLLYNSDFSKLKNNGVINGFPSPFIPGLGYRSGGINLLLYFNLMK